MNVEASQRPATPRSESPGRTEQPAPAPARSQRRPGAGPGAARPSRAGSSDSTIVVVVGLVAALLLLGITGGLFFVQRGRAQTAQVQAELARAQAQAELVRRQAEERQRREAEAFGPREWSSGGLSVREPAGPRDEPAPPPSRDQFEGRGVLVGSVYPPPGQDMPPRWTVHIGPCKGLTGSEHAVTRHSELPGERTEFAFEDLPLAGYEVRVEAQGLQSDARQVMLVKQQSRVHLMIQLEPVSWVTGRVVDAQALPVDELAVTLERASDRSRLQALTDGAGFYRFEDITDGEYRLLLGSPDNPLRDPAQIVVRAPGLTLPELSVPPLGEIEVTVEDALGTRIAGADVNGFGSAGGLVEGQTDSSGRVRIRFLPPGKYKLFGSLREVGTGWVRVELAAGEHGQARIEIGGQR